MVIVGIVLVVVIVVVVVVVVVVGVIVLVVVVVVAVAVIPRFPMNYIGCLHWYYWNSSGTNRPFIHQFLYKESGLVLKHLSRSRKKQRP